MPDNYEKLVRWYLRFNGYLTIESFVVHEPKEELTTGQPTPLESIPQGGEFDTLAVRFPFSREEVQGNRIQNDPRLEDREIQQKYLLDFVIAEVKGGAGNSLNRIWLQDNKAQELAYVLRWLGPIENEKDVMAVAAKLQRERRALHNGSAFRLLYFSHKNCAAPPWKGIQQITFKEIAEFILKIRTPCWAKWGMGAKSLHNQWDSLIVEIWEIAGRGGMSDEEKIAEMLATVSKR